MAAACFCIGSRLGAHAFLVLPPQMMFVIGSRDHDRSPHAVPYEELGPLSDDSCNPSRQRISKRTIGKLHMLKFAALVQKAERITAGASRARSRERCRRSTASANSR